MTSKFKINRNEIKTMENYTVIALFQDNTIYNSTESSQECKLRSALIKQNDRDYARKYDQN